VKGTEVYCLLSRFQRQNSKCVKLMALSIWRHWTVLCLYETRALSIGLVTRNYTGQCSGAQPVYKEAYGGPSSKTFTQAKKNWLALSVITYLGFNITFFFWKKKKE